MPLSNYPTATRWKLAALIGALVGCLVSPFLSANAKLRTTAFHYGLNPPVFELAQYDDVVLEPNHTKPQDTAFLAAENTLSFAYLSLGELRRDQRRAAKLPDQLFVSRNKDWGSLIPDQTASEWRTWLLKVQIPQLMAMGFNGLFLDTLDSYKLSGLNNIEQRDALIETIAQIHRKWPSLKLFFNRGFDIVERSSVPVHALAAESLFQRWNSKTKQYDTVSQNDRDWLTQKLADIKKGGTPVTIIDYVSADNPSLARETARKISRLGFTPWVAQPALDHIGVGTFSHSPRRTLVVYDSAEGRLEFNPAHTKLGAPMDYLGLIPIFHDVRSGPPKRLDPSVYNGVVFALSADNRSGLTPWQEWTHRVLDNAVPVVFFNHLPFSDPKLLNRLGLVETKRAAQKPISIVRQSKIVGHFEAKVKTGIRGLQLLQNQANENISLLEINDAAGTRFDPIVVAPWGGMALQPYTYTHSRRDHTKWILEPIEFLRQALQLEPRPLPDATTENGLRILTSHIDGDGFVSRAEMPGSPYSAEVIFEQILKPYKLPHTVSVIEGEVGQEGLYPEQSAALEEWARKIFRLSNVELASHSYSHPYFWQPEKVSAETSQRYGLSMPIPDYTPTMAREINGSIDYINERLAPSSKKVKVMLWTGDALPSDEAIARTYTAGVANMNGGNTLIKVAHNSLSEVYPIGRLTKGGMHVYAPVMNENVYTNDWTGPFYGFKRVIETFELTGHPRRVKPISIYWHFYSGTKQAALNALKEVYDWADTQDYNAQYISEYSPRAVGAYSASVAKTDKGVWRLRGFGKLRTVRIDKTMGVPDLNCSTGIAGWNDTDVGRYVHLTESSADLCLSDKHSSTAARLLTSNGKIDYWAQKGQATELKLDAHEPVKFTVSAKGQCSLSIGDKSLEPLLRNKSGEQQHSFNLSTRSTGHAILVCK